MLSKFISCALSAFFVFLVPVIYFVQGVVDGSGT